jgi:hypothetical protein
VTADAEIVKRALGSFFVTVVVAWVLRVAVRAVASNALYEYRHAARFGSFVMAADALGASLRLMGELTIRVEIRFVVPVTECYDTASPFEIELYNAGGCVDGFDSLAITLFGGRARV